LATSILEKTKIEFNDEAKRMLEKAMKEDENLHLRRKAAIALFRHGDRDGSVVSSLNEAKVNDPELGNEVTRLLDNLGK